MGILDTIKSIADITQKINDIELKSKIIDLQNEVYQLIEENHELRSEIRLLKNDKEMRNDLVFIDNMYYLKEDKDRQEPFCSPCLDSDKKLIRMHINSFGLYICPICVKRNQHS